MSLLCWPLLEEGWGQGTSLLAYQGRRANQQENIMLGSWYSVTTWAVQTLDSLQLDFFLPQGKMRRDQPMCMDEDSRTRKVTAAIGT